MKEKMCNIPDEILEKLQKDISEIKVALLGNEYNPEGGLLYRTKHNEDEIVCLRDRIAKLEEKFNKVVWITTGAAGAMTIIWNVIAWLIERF